MTDSEGCLRSVVPFLANYAGDLEELLEHELDGPHICAPRTGESILATLHTLRDTYPDATSYEFMIVARNHGLIGVEDPWFEGVVDDPCRIVGVDLIGKEPLDCRFMMQPHFVGSEVRNFPLGISQLKQVQGKEFRVNCCARLSRLQHDVLIPRPYRADACTNGPMPTQSHYPAD